MRKVRKWLANPHFQEIQEKLEFLSDQMIALGQTIREVHESISEIELQVDHIESHMPTTCSAPKTEKKVGRPKKT